MTSFSAENICDVPVCPGTCFWELLLHPGLYTQKGNKFTKIGSNSRIYIKLNLLMVKSGNLISRVPAGL